MLAQIEGTHQVIEFSELKFAQNQRRSDQSDKLSTSNLFSSKFNIPKQENAKKWKMDPAVKHQRYILGHTF